MGFDQRANVLSVSQIETWNAQPKRVRRQAPQKKLGRGELTINALWSIDLWPFPPPVARNIPHVENIVMRFQTHDQRVEALGRSAIDRLISAVGQGLEDCLDVTGRPVWNR